MNKTTNTFRNISDITVVVVIVLQTVVMLVSVATDISRYGRGVLHAA